MPVNATANTEAEPEPELEMTAEEKYNSQVEFVGARLEVLPLYDRVVPGFVNRLPVLFQFVTGKDASLRRDPFSLAVVLDVSGSMAGEKLASCKKAVAQLIDSTSDDDVLALVVYDDRVNTVFDCIRCGDCQARQSMKDKLLEVQPGGGTDLYNGLLTGYDLLLRQGNNLSKHLFLLSDGEANSGHVQSTDGILKAVSEWKEKIPILSYGIGAGFNEKLMSPLGQVHRGSHYFYLTDSASIEKLIARGMRALTAAVARNVNLKVRPLNRGVWLPDNMIEGNLFPLVRERSVIQFLLELEVRPELTNTSSDQCQCALTHDTTNSHPDFASWFLCAKRSTRRPHNPTRRPSTAPQGPTLSFAWEVEGFPLLSETCGIVGLTISSDRGQKLEEVRAFLDIKRGCELRRAATSSPEARKTCQEALSLFEGCLGHDRFGFAQEWADKTRALLDDATMWTGNAASAGGAKHLGVAYHGAHLEEEEEEEMDFDLFG